MMTKIILETIIGIVLLCITGLVIPWIKANTTAAQQETLALLLDMLVSAAEQYLGSDGDGEKKLELVEGWLVERGIDATRADIEAAVFRLNNA